MGNFPKICGMLRGSLYNIDLDLELINETLKNEDIKKLRDYIKEQIRISERWIQVQHTGEYDIEDFK